MTRTFTPRPYQDLAVEHMHEHERCALWAGCGMGKTSATLYALDGLYISGETKPTLVTAPLRVARDVWADESQKWSNLRHIEVSPIIGTPKERERALRNTNASVFAVNYENIPWLIEHYGPRWPFANIVSDESTRLKSFRGGFRRHYKTGKVYYQRGGGHRARELGRVAHTKLVKRFIELTGTPSPNGLVDLWGQAWFLDAGQRLGGSFEAFQQRWFSYSRPVTAENRHEVQLVPLPFAQEEIQERLRDICMSINPKDWFDLKDPVVNTIKVRMPRSARALYQSMEREMFVEIAGHGVEAPNAAAKQLKCLQIANGFAFVDKSAKEWRDLHEEKLQALESIVEEAAGAPVFVAYHFEPDLARLKRAFPDALDLSKQDDLRAAKAGNGRVWLAHPASCGHGIDGLQEHCNIGVFYANWWDLEAHDQFLERIGPMRQHQAGFDRPVFLHYLVAEDTVDEVVLLRHATKRAPQDLLLDYMKGKK